MNDRTPFPHCTGAEAEALNELLAEHGRDLYRFVTVNELGEMIEDRALRIIRRRRAVRQAA